MKKKICFVTILISVVAVLVFFFISLATSGKPSAPDYFFLITLDTTRADHINYSRNNSETPHLANLAKNGIIFSNAYSLIPITLPSHASIFHSLPPHILKVFNNQQVNRTPYPSLAQLFKKNGYQTGAVISLGVLGSNFGMAKGFDVYRENFRPHIWYKTAEEVNHDALKLIKKIAKKKSFFWIHYSDPHAPYSPPDYKGDFSIFFNNEKIFTCNSIDQPLVELEFLAKPGKNILAMKTAVPYSKSRKTKIIIMGINFMNFSLSSQCSDKEMNIIFSPNWKKITPRGNQHYITRKKFSRNVLINKTNQPIKIQIKFNYKLALNRKALKMLYGQEVQHMDQNLGELIDFLKKNQLYQKSLFIVMGDHGEGLGEHRRCVGHIHYLNKLYLHVPLIMFGKGVKNQGTINHSLVSNLNIAPTLLDMANIKKPEFMIGNSLLKSKHSDHLLLETYSPEAHSDGFSIIKFPFQIIYYPQRTEEKFEFINLEDDLLGINNQYGQKNNQKIKTELINAVVKVSKELIKNKEKPGIMTSEQIKILKSLGYL